MTKLLKQVSLSPMINVGQAQLWRNDPRIWSTCRQNHIITDYQQMRWAENIDSDPTIQMLGIYAKESARGLGVTDLSTGKVDLETHFVGVCGLTSINSNHGTAEFSLYIGPEYQGKGYGKAALIHLLDYGFNRLRLETVWGEVMQHNQAANMFQDVGFTVMKDMCRSRYFKGGKRIGSFQCDILRDEFNSKWGGCLWL